MNIPQFSPWKFGFVRYTYLLTKNKKDSCLRSCDFNWASQGGLPIPLSSSGSFYLIKYALSFKITSDF